MARSKLTVIAVGKTDEAEYARGVERYGVRIRRFFSLDLVEIREEKGGQAPKAASIMRAEAQRILRAVPSHDQVVVLDCEGRTFDSPGFAAELARRVEQPHGVSFILGGAFGLAPEIKATADLLLSLSRLTFPHQLARLLLLEQIYRALSSRAGIRYHK